MINSSVIEIGAKKELEIIIKRGLLKDKTIFFMGNIINLLPLIRIVEQSGVTVDGLVDNDRNKSGLQDYKGYNYHVFEPEYFFSFDKDKVAIIIYSERFWRQMSEQMTREGYIEGNNLFVLEGITEKKKHEYIEKSFNMLMQLKKKYGNDAFIYVFYGPMGDNYLFAGFIRYYNEIHQINNPICLGTVITKKICELYGFRNVEILDRESIVAFEYLYMFLGEELENVLILPLWDWAFHFNRDCIRLDPGFSFIDTFRVYTYGLKKDIRLLPPAFCDNHTSWDPLEKPWFKEKRTVIFSPFAYSIPFTPPGYFWQCLCDKFIKAGFSVAVSIDPGATRNKEECFVNNANPISFELKDGMRTLEKAGYFVGMRSGLCDVFWNARCRKTVLYPMINKIDYERHRSDMGFGSLARMYGADDTEEIEFECYRDNDNGYWESLATSIVSGALGDARVS